MRTGKRGPIRRFCSPECQGKNWRRRYAAELHATNAARWRTATPEFVAGGRLRSKARQRALSQLALRYPKLYERLYEYYIEELTREHLSG